jgi:hypothetical protein
MAAAAILGNSSACNKMGNYNPISMQVGIQTKKSMLSSKLQKRGVGRFKMTAAAILEIEMNAIKWAITIRF